MKKPEISWLWSFEKDCLCVYFKPSGKTGDLNREFIEDFKGDVSGFFTAVTKMWELNLSDQYLLKYMLDSNKKLSQMLELKPASKNMPVASGNFNSLMKPGLKSAWEAYAMDMLSYLDQVAPIKKKVHFVDIGDGMLVPRDLYYELVAQFKAEDEAAKWKELVARYGYDVAKAIMYSMYYGMSKEQIQKEIIPAKSVAPPKPKVDYYKLDLLLKP
jgi:hypothetical protein